MDSIYRRGRHHTRVRQWCSDRLVHDGTSTASLALDLHRGHTHVNLLGENLPGSTVVFLPGTNLCAAAQLPFLHGLADLGPVMAPDIPGQPGLSDRRRVRDAPLSYLGAWLDELLARLDRPCVLLGHSLGAAVCLAARSAYIERRILLNPAGIVDLALPYRTLRRPSGGSPDLTTRAAGTCSDT